VGTALRAVTEAALPTAGLPVATFGINVLGSFLLGALLEALRHRGTDTGARRLLRLGLGTGLLGGFTTYSTFAVETVALPPALGAGYLVSSLVLGAAAALAGILLGRRLT
jgi:CrcB protein